MVSGETIAASVLRHEYRVVKVTTITALCDLLIAAELGMPPGPMTLQRIRAHVLGRPRG